MKVYLGQEISLLAGFLFLELNLPLEVKSVKILHSELRSLKNLKLLKNAAKRQIFWGFSAPPAGGEKIVRANLRIVHSITPKDLTVNFKMLNLN